MAEKKWWWLRGWLRNVWKAPWQALQAWLETGSDVVNTTTWFFQDILNSCRATKDKIVGLFSQDKKRYQKLLNVPVAWVVGLSWVVEAAVKPVLKWAINVWKTAVKVPINAGKVVGSVLTSEPKNISYDTLKTKKKEYKISTAGPWTWIEKLDKRVLNTEKSWFDGRGNRTWSKNKQAAAAAASAATAAAVSAEVAKVTKTFEQKLKDVETACKKQIEDVLATNKKLTEQNAALQKANTELEKTNKELLKTIESLKKSDKQPEAKVDNPEKKADTPKPDKPEAKEGWKGSDWKAKEGDWKTKAPDGGKKEATEWKSANRWSYTVDWLIEKWSRDEALFEFAKKRYPNLEISFKNGSPVWHVENNIVEIWTEMPRDPLMIAIGNEERDPKKQIKHVLDHELAHIKIADEADENVKWLKDTLRNIITLKWKPLTKLATMNIYKTVEEQANEDACEFISLYARENWDFNSYLNSLVNWSNWVQISSYDAGEIKKYCENIFANLNTQGRTVQMYSSPVSMAA